MQLAQFLLQALTALFQRLHLAVGVALRLRHQGQVLLDARQRGAHLVSAAGGFAHALLDVGQRRLGVLGGGARLFGAGSAGGQVILGLGDLFGAVLALGVPLGDLLLQLLAARLQAVARIHHVADLGLQAADLGVGFVELALGGVDRVAGGIVRLAARFQLGLAGAQAGDGGFQLVLRLQHFLGLAGAFFARAGFLQEPQRMLLFRRRPAARGSAWRLRPAPPAFRAGCSARAGYPRPGSGSRACRTGGFRFRGGALYSETRRQPLPGTPAVLRGAPRSGG